MFVSYHVFYTQEEFNSFVRFLEQKHIPYGIYPMQTPERLRNAHVYAVMRLVLYRFDDYQTVQAAYGSDDDALS